MASERQVSIIETRSEFTGGAESTATAKALDKAIDGVTESSKQLTQAEINLQGALDRMDAKYNEATRNANELARAQNLIARARAQNVGTEEQYARVLAGVAEKQAQAAQRATGSMQQLGAAANQNSKNFGLASHQLQNLGFQLNDLVVQIGSGGGIFRPLLQQGAQVQQILSMSEGGVSGVLSRVADKMRAIGPAALLGWGAAATAIGAVVTGTVLAIKATIDYQQELADTQRLLTSGRGRMSGIAPSDIEGAGAAAAGAPDSKITRSDARAAAREYASLGKIGREVMTDLTALTDRYARSLGIDLPQAAKELGAAFADPAKGVEFLANRLGILDAAQINNIQTLARTEGTYAAQKALIQASANAVHNFGEEMWTVSNIARRFSKDVTDDFDRLNQAVGRALSPGTLDDQVKALQAAQRSAKFEEQTRPPGAARQESRDEELLNRGEELRRQQAAGMARTAQAGIIAFQQLGREAVAALDPIGQKFIELETKAKALRDAIAVTGPGPELDALRNALEMATTAMDGATTAAEARAMAMTNLQAQSNLAISAIQAETQATLAKTDAERMAAAEQQAEIARAQAIQALRGTTANQQRMELAGEIAYQQAMAQSNAARAVRMAQGELEIQQGARAAAQQQLNIQSQLAYTAAEQRAAAVAQAAAAAQEAYTSAIQRGLAPEQAKVLAQQAANRVMAEFQAKVDAAVAAANRQIAANNLAIRAIQAKTVAERADIAAQQSMMATESSLMTTTQRLTIAEQERLKVLEQSKAAVQQMITAQQGEIALLQASISSINMEKSAREALLAGIRAENQLVAMGIDLNTDYAQTYIRNAEAIARMSVELERAEARQRAYNTTASQAATKVTKSIIPLENTMASIFEGSAGFQQQIFGFWGSPQEAADQWLEQQIDREKFMATFGKGKGAPAISNEEAERRARLTAQTANADRWGFRLKDFIEPPEEELDKLADAAQTASEKLGDISSLSSPIESRIDSLRGLQEAALSRAYRPDPYAEKNPEFFYNGEKIMKEAQDKIYDGLQAQIVKLESLQSSLGTLVQQNEMLPQTLVDALVAAGFADIAQKIVEAFTTTAAADAPSATPNPTAVQGGYNDTWGGRANYGTNWKVG